MSDDERSDETGRRRKEQVVMMAKIDVKFMSANRATQRQMGGRYTKSGPGKKTARPKGKK